ncbi:hypothetical protein EV363DRAFT_1424920 [Boletus edulis]|nr:hypothetical protein EV363DRAFT_1424920 [Boletus edulis]
MLQDAAQPFNVPEETLSKGSEGPLPHPQYQTRSGIFHFPPIGLFSNSLRRQLTLGKTISCPWMPLSSTGTRSKTPTSVRAYVPCLLIKLTTPSPEKSQSFEMLAHGSPTLRTQCFLAHVRGNHWTAFAIDSGNLQIHYSDSLQAPVPADLKSAIEWWLSNHFSLPFTWSSLEICEQSDSYSCGLFAAKV